MLSRDAISGMFAKRKATEGEPTGAPARKKKKKATGAGPSGRAPEPVVGLEAPGAPTGVAEPVVEERGEATESDSPARDAAQPSCAPSPGQSVSVSTGRHPDGQTGGRAGQSAYRTEREGTVRVGRGESVVGNPALARRLVALAIAPRDEVDLGSRTTKEVLMSSFAGLVLAAHNIFSLEKVYEDSQKLARSCSERVAAAETDRDAARESVRTLEDREKAFKDEIARLKADGARVTRKLAEVQSDLETTRVALGSSGAAVETAQSESRAFQLEAQSAREQARLAAKEAEEAKEAAVRAVETYKASADHTSDLVESSRLFYVTGFGNCKKEIGEAFPNLDLSAIEEPVFVGAGQASGSEEEEEETESEGETTEGAPTAGQTAGVDQAPSEPPQILLAPTEFELVDLTGGSTEERAPAGAPSSEPAMDPGQASAGVVVGTGAPESSIV